MNIEEKFLRERTSDAVQDILLNCACQTVKLRAENKTELAALLALAEECEGSPDWKHGEALIRESYWIEYVEEMLKVCGDLPQSIPWYIAIDWDETTQNIAQDYSIVAFDRVDYYIRSC